jgi:hypothetical protein
MAKVAKFPGYPFGIATAYIEGNRVVFTTETDPNAEAITSLQAVRAFVDVLKDLLAEP